MKHCLSILGWHFSEEFYRSLARVPGDKYIICHRPRDFVSRLTWLDSLTVGDNGTSPSFRCGERVGVRGVSIAEPHFHAPSPLPLSRADGGEGEEPNGLCGYQCVPPRQAAETLRDHLYLCENRGLDWGGYHQFNAMGYWESYDFVIYCHDDLVVKDPAFADAVADRLADPRVMVVGNGCNGSDTEFRLGKYNPRLGIADSDDFLVRTVRGSFLAVRREVFRRIGNFPVHWKTERKIEKGNRSLRRFGYHVTKEFGRDAITYLEPDSWLDTHFLIELRRGEPATQCTS